MGWHQSLMTWNGSSSSVLLDVGGVLFLGCSVLGGDSSTTTKGFADSVCGCVDVSLVAMSCDSWTVLLSEAMLFGCVDVSVVAASLVTWTLLLPEATGCGCVDIFVVIASKVS